MAPHSDFMADHLDGLAENLVGAIPPPDVEVKRAMLRGLAHVSRSMTKLEREVARLDQRVAKLEVRDDALDHLVRRVDALESQLAEKKAEFRGGWWTACLIAGVAASAISAGWAIYTAAAR